MEIWKDIPGFEGIYQVSNLGNVRSLDRIVKYKDGREGKYKGKLRKTLITDDGYLQVQLCGDGKNKTIKVHRLVAEAFIPNPNDLPEVNHKDEDKTNNAVSNLEWCTHIYNSLYGTRGERISKKHGKPVDAYAPGDTRVSLRFDSMLQAAEYLGVARESIRQAIKYGWKCKGYTIKLSAAETHRTTNHPSNPLLDSSEEPVAAP